jgi:hypothetical protein
VAVHDANHIPQTASAGKFYSAPSSAGGRTLLSGRWAKDLRNERGPQAALDAAAASETIEDDKTDAPCRPAWQVSQLIDPADQGRAAEPQCEPRSAAHGDADVA